MAEDYDKYFNDDDFLEGWMDYWDWRKKRKMPVTDRVGRSLMKKIEMYSNGDVEKAVKIVDQALENGWQTFWPLKDNVFVSNNGLKSRKSL